MTNTRKLIDKVGFASEAGQMEEFYKRLTALQGEKLQSSRERAGINDTSSWRLAVCPHDDYTYVGYHYPLVLEQVKAKTIFIFGVAHKAVRFQLHDQVIFDSFDSWEGAYGQIKISPLREQLINELSPDDYIIHNEMQQVEHSIEAMLPFLQRMNKEIEIIPILIPHSSLEKIDSLSESLARSIAKITEKAGMIWGQDFTLLTTTDAVHYGDEDWGERSLAPMGTGKEANEKVLEHEQRIIDTCFRGDLSQNSAYNFFRHTVAEDDYFTYRWTWCGRYAVTAAMLTAYYLNELLIKDSLKIYPLSYSSSIINEHIPVGDLVPMGVTAPAKERHWVGYASVGML